MSDWIEVLRTQCTKTSQAKVCAQLRVYQSDGFPSGTVINQVLKGKYPGRTERLQALVEGVFMSSVVACPVVGDIPSDQCIQYQGKPYAATNPTRIKLYQACRGGCPHSKLEV
ncbi:transcriptional regulator [Methylophaga nitratireducenticrescens]|uniref:transcriptional regulator n=1 Tax=Methylophaga nitratireducenticrescens TaxID=754476 RepID=UPI000CDC6CA2|nr:transcriptional regulator [Methylophaga nitratireducenticrescens]AUZ85809.1 transcriptional regulator [Methylophaga nitratireducenticrescens]AUZ85877.1 transcriptional regulator [Methylophaga nitratireducenticrescens]